MIVWLLGFPVGGLGRCTVCGRGLGLQCSSDLLGLGLDFGVLVLCFLNAFELSVLVGLLVLLDFCLLVCVGVIVD